MWRTTTDHWISVRAVSPEIFVESPQPIVAFILCLGFELVVDPSFIYPYFVGPWARF